jgi:uncharacterized protein YecT (DUF1311 family)
MRNAKLTTILFLILGSATILTAQEEEICNRYKNIAEPSEAHSTQVPKEYPTCESYKSYAGIGRDPNYAAALACAWKEHAAQAVGLGQNPKSGLSWVIGGSLILSNLYANGRGTAQDIPLAIHFACESPDSYVPETFTDLESRIGNPKVNKPFELCDYAGTTFESNFCASYSNEKSGSARDREAADVSRNWPASHKAAFLAAKKAYDTYVETVVSDETYMGGTIRTVRSLSAADALQENFTAELRLLESGKLPRASAAEFQQHDADLNRIFQEAIGRAQRTLATDKTRGFPAAEDIQPAGIRNAQRAWLAYRDTWVSFTTQHYPGTTREAWLNEVTEFRLHRLLLLTCNRASREKLCTSAIHKEIESRY